MNEPNEGIELLYTRDCRSWPEAPQNLKAALAEVGLADEPQLIVIDTQEQAATYNFFASPTVHIHGQDADQMARRISRRGLGTARPYFYKGKIYNAPPVALLVAALAELYYPRESQK